MSHGQNGFFFILTGVSALQNPVHVDYITVFCYRLVGLSDNSMQSPCAPEAGV